MTFIPIQTKDNSISLFNIEINDVYHSKVGAYTEALHKYVIPSELIEFIKSSKQVKILDVCYGLGYNSKTAVDEILKINPDINIQITAFEIDPVVLAFSTIFGIECFNDEVNFLFFEKISKHINIQQIIKNHIQNIAHICPEIKSKIANQYKIIQTENIEAKLHNIYYVNPHLGDDIFIKICSILIHLTVDV